MADPEAIVEKIVKFGLQIKDKDAVDTVCYNEEECQEIKKHVLRLNGILLLQQQTGMMNPSMRGELVDLEESVQHALELVTACQEAKTAAGDLSKQLHRLKIHILLASIAFASTGHTIKTDVHLHLPSQQLEDVGLVEESYRSQSTNDARSQLNDVQSNILAGSEPLIAVGGIRIFTERQLKNITSSYSYIIGRGFFSDVYMGVIKDGGQDKHVAVKCTATARLPPEYIQKGAGMSGFLKEITFQFHMKHPNMVCLIGCCLETDDPILVFEFISNGSLEDKLHSANKYSSLSLLQRLNIAIGSAEALSYMHSHGECSHVHGDIKSANILIDENLNAKISDFGSSKLLSVKNYVKDVSADRNYADPVYISTGQFTVKSDVYSFGVVLLELITRKKARYSDNCSLPMDFKNSWNDKIKTRSMYDTDIISNDQHLIKCLDMVGALALRCLSTDRDERPTMGEVVVILKIVKSIASGES